jgi:hypothetical protein
MIASLTIAASSAGENPDVVSAIRDMSTDLSSVVRRACTLKTFSYSQVLRKCQKRPSVNAKETY